MCTDDYLEMQSCDLPWMRDADGACTLLIEDHINSHGPSRRVYMSYLAIVSLFGFVMTFQRFVYVWADPTLQHNFGFFQRLLQPQVRVVGWQAYGALMLGLQAIDPMGWGGRLPFVVWMLFKHHAIAGFLAATATLLALWSRKMGHGGDEVARERRQRIVQGYATVCLTFTSSIAPPLAVYLRPADAPFGIHNGVLLAVGVSAIHVLLLLLVATFTLEFLELRRCFLRTQTSLRSRRFAAWSMSENDRGKMTRRTHVRQASPTTESSLQALPASPALELRRVTVAESRRGKASSVKPYIPQAWPDRIDERARHTRGVQVGAGEGRRTLPFLPSGRSPVSETMVGALVQQHRREGSPSPTGAELATDTEAGPDLGTYHKFAKQVAMLWVLVILACVGDLMGSVYRFRVCWVSREPHDRQWMELSSTFHLVVLVVFLVAPLKTRCPCGRSALQDFD